MKLSAKLFAGATLTILLFVPAFASAADRPLFANSNQVQTVTFERGDLFFASDSAASTVIFAPRFESKTLMSLHFTVLNTDSSRVNVFGDGVRAKINGHAVAVLGEIELEKAEKRRRAWENVAAALAAGANAYAGAQQQTSTVSSRHEGTISTSYGSPVASYSGTTTATYVDEVAAARRRQEANDRTQRILASTHANQVARQAILDNSVLSNHTIAPDATYSGFVKLKVPRAARDSAVKLEVALVVGRDVHAFNFAADKSLPTEDFPHTYVHGGSPPNSDEAGESGNSLAPHSQVAAITAEPLRSRPEVELRSKSGIPEPPANYPQQLESPKTIGKSPARPLFTATILGLSIHSVTTGGASKSYAFFDISWETSTTTLSRKYTGHLIVSDQQNVDRLAMPWVIDAESAKKPSFEELQVGFEMESLGHGGAWLRTIDPANLRARFEPSTLH